MVSAADHYHALIRPVYYWTDWSWDAQDMHGASRELLVAEGREPALIAADLNSRSRGETLCSDSPQDGFWHDTLYEAAGFEPSFTVAPLGSFVGRSEADEIYRLIPSKHAHRALPDAPALMRAALDYFKLPG